MKKNVIKVVNSEFLSNTNVSIVFHYGILDQCQVTEEIWNENVTISHSSNEDIFVYGRDVETKFFMKNITITDHVFLPIDKVLEVVVVLSAINITFEVIAIENSLVTPLLAVDSNIYIYIKGVKNVFKNNTGSVVQ